MTQTTHQQQPDANDVLMGGGGAASATWPAEGSTVGGRIVAKPQSYHVRKFDRANPGAGALAYYPSGDPIMGIRVDVQTSERLAADDDGIRRLYVEKKRQLAAVRDAVRSIGETGIQMGGHLTLTWTGLEQGEGTEPAKTWSATYRPPTTPVPAAPGGSPSGTAPQGGYSVTPNGLTAATYAPQTAPTAPPQQWPAPQGPPPAWAAPAPQPQPVPLAATPQYVPQQYTPEPHPYVPPAAPAPVVTSITETQAAAMRNAGIDTSLFAVVPG